MECNQDINLALQLLVEDLSDLEGQQKGKQVAGKPSDVELTIATMKNDILAAQASIQDEILAISTSNAIATDQNIIMSIKDDERVSYQDRQYAVSLNGDERNTHRISTRSKPIPEDNDNNAISTIMADLMDRMSLSDKTGNGEGSSRSTLSSQARSLKRNVPLVLSSMILALCL